MRANDVLSSFADDQSTGNFVRVNVTQSPLLRAPLTLNNGWRSIPDSRRTENATDGVSVLPAPTYALSTTARLRGQSKSALKATAYNIHDAGDFGASAHTQTEHVEHVRVAELAGPSFTDLLNKEALPSVILNGSNVLPLPV